MKIYSYGFALFILLWFTTSSFGAHGIAIANFGIVGQVNEDGTLLGLVKYNKPQVGAHLEKFGTVSIKINDKMTSAFSHTDVKMSWPLSYAELSDEPLGLEVKAHAFAPVQRNDALVSCLPIIYVLLDITNTRATSQPVIVSMSHSEIDAGFAQEPEYACLTSDGSLIGVKGQGRAVGSELQRTVAVAAGDTQRFTLFLLRYDDRCFYANTYPTLTDLAKYAAAQDNQLWDVTKNVAAAMPVTGKAKVDPFTPWYYACGTMLTKRLKDGQSWTMGYTNLTIRDWYWTTWVHLELWPELYRDMLALVASHQFENGKIMTAINPDIERGNDIDSNLFYVLAVFRYLFTYNDWTLVDEHWEAVTQAMDWVVTRDQNNDGIPDQINTPDGYWADWFDIPQVVGRQYGPFFTLLWLATLKQTVLVAELRGDVQVQSKYQVLYDQAYANTHKPLHQGGQWNEDQHRYESIWYPGYEEAEYANRCYVDQTVGILFGVVPEDRVGQVQDTLRQTLQCPYGLKTMDKGNDYWSGGIRPWLNFIHCAGCFITGREQEGLAIMDALAQADLVNPGEYLVHEWINPDSGSNEGHYVPQGWCSDWVMAVQHGLLRDKTAPAKPDRLRREPAHQHQLHLLWDAATDRESRFVFYTVYRDGKEIGRTMETSFVDQAVSLGTDHTYRVSAVNASPIRGAWLEGGKSDTLKIYSLPSH